MTSPSRSKGRRKKCRPPKRRYLEYPDSGCRLCGCRLVRFRTVQRWRSIVRETEFVVEWQSPLGDVVSMPIATRDHILPRRLWRSLAHNKQWLCGPCHHQKTAIDARQFGDDPQRWDSCIECGQMLSRGPTSCTVCRVYRGAPLVAWLVRTGRVRRGPAPRPRDRASASPPLPTHTSEAALGDRISAL